MAYIKKIRDRGASGVVTAYGEIMFAPGGVVNSWTNRFANRIGSETRKAAPTNKRPRWAHYGKPLKATITASRPEFRPTARGARVYAAVGSTAPYAYYVDQGTGIHGGNGPYQAKILPPWQRGSASLYEHTWRPGGPRGRPIGTVTVRGQEGQGFFEKGLARGFLRMKNRSVQVPGDGVAKMSRALAALPRGLERPGNTPASGSFVLQLEEWRKWRDEAWDAKEGLGRGGGIGSRAHARFIEQKRRERQARRDQNWKGSKAPKSTKTAPTRKKKPEKKPETKTKVSRPSVSADRSAFLAAMIKKYGKVDRGSLGSSPKNGYWTMLVWGEDSRGRKTWIEVRARAKSG